MMDCWTYSPSSRPTFKYCLEVLEELKSSTIDGPLTAIQTGDYISTIPNGMLIHYLINASPYLYLIKITNILFYHYYLSCFSCILHEIQITIIKEYLM